MAQQTALQELLQWVRATLPMDLDTPRMIEEKIESLLPKEKEQIMKAFSIGNDCGYDFAKTEDSQQFNSSEQYYNETYQKK